MPAYKITGENRKVFGNEHFTREIRLTGRSITKYKDERPVMPHHFRCCDDDGVTYFWGVCSSDSTFAPLDYEGADYGCTYIEYRNPITGEWEML